MREVAERDSWRKLNKQTLKGSILPLDLAIDSGESILLDRRCIVLSGLNGAGKSRALTTMSEALGQDHVHLRLHEACEQVRSILRSRDDIEAMQDEVGPLPLSDDTASLLKRIIGRDYDEIEWFNLELESTDDLIPSWPRPLDQSQVLVPHFRVRQGDLSYSSLDMGLGEFSVHLLFWVLLQYHGTANLLILLDEPDAYLPPKTRQALMAHLLTLLHENEWHMVLTSHSETLIEWASSEESLYYLLRSPTGVSALKGTDHASDIAKSLLTPPAISRYLFCEDESAAALLQALLRASGTGLDETVSIIWKDGDGYLNKLFQHLPRHDFMPMRFALVFDGDARNNLSAATKLSDRRWPRLLLPTSESPDALLRSLKNNPQELSQSLNCSPAALQLFLDSQQGVDDHDWVNNLCARFTPRVWSLAAIAALWVELNESEVQDFLSEYAEHLQ